MITPKLALITLPLAALLACTPDKSGEDESSGDATDGATSSGSTTSGATEPEVTTSAGPTSGPTTAGPTTDDPTDGPNTSGSTGDNTTGETGGNPPCIDTPTVLAIDEASMGGFSGEQLLVDKLGPRATQLRFADEPTTLSPDWKGIELELTVTLRHEGGEVRWVDAEPNPDYDDSGNESGFTECTDRLEIDVEIDFVSADGAFDEHREAVLTATAVDRADLQADLLPPGLMGTFDVSTVYTPDEMMTVIEAVTIHGTWQGTMAGGNLMHEIRVGGEDGFIGFGPLAGWGDPIGI